MRFTDNDKNIDDVKAGESTAVEGIAGAEVLDPGDCTWDDVDLSPRAEKAVRDIARRAASGRGVAALFSGPPGSGKTRTAGLLARDLERQLVHVKLSELQGADAESTRAALERLFEMAEPQSKVLLFDEADALFCERGNGADSETDNANRCAELEQHFLSCMENYPGLAILATDHCKRINPALVHRLHYALKI